MVVHELEDKDASDGLTGADLTRMSDMWRERVELVERILSSGDRIMVPRAEFQARSVTLEITDNGRGIALDKLRGRAQSLGASANDDTELLSLIWRDGCSTADDVSDTSGRGVGLAALKAAVERAGGGVGVRTEAGRGTTFTFTFAASSSEGLAAAAE